VDLSSAEVRQAGLTLTCGAGLTLTCGAGLTLTCGAGLTLTCGAGLTLTGLVPRRDARAHGSSYYRSPRRVKHFALVVGDYQFRRGDF
jgi:hypothetical protein